MINLNNHETHRLIDKGNFTYWPWPSTEDAAIIHHQVMSFQYEKNGKQNTFKISSVNFPLDDF
jgi:hypothetical protein